MKLHYMPMQTHLSKHLALALTLLIFVGCSTPKPESSAPAVKTETSRAIPVVAQAVRQEPFTLSKSYTGTLEGDQQANIVAKISEKVVEIPVKIGDAVRKGKVILRLDKQGPSSRYYQAESAWRNADLNAKRMQALFDAGAISRQTLDDALTQAEVLRAELDAAQSLVDLTSPIDGVVTAIDVNVGDVASPGVPVAVVADARQMKIVFHAGESDLQYLEIGGPVEVSSELRSDLRRVGEIVQLARSANTATRTFETKARFDNTDDGWFRPGMFGVAVVNYTTPQAVLFIPRTAIVNTDKGSSVYVIAGNKVVRKEVSLGISNDEFAAVEGLSAGDRVVTMGTNKLSDGAVVTVVDTAQFEVAETDQGGSIK
jgi:membrane fusion protein (multidrug efflux system)